MNRSFVKPFVLAAVVCLLCATAVGCKTTVTTDTQATPVQSASSVTPPTIHRVPVDSNNLFLGTWSVSAQKATFTDITFHQNGSIIMSFANNNTLGGCFFLTGENEIELALTSSSIKGTYTVSDDTVTITTDTDTLVLTKQ